MALEASDKRLAFSYVNDIDGIVPTSTVEDIWWIGVYFNPANSELVFSEVSNCFEFDCVIDFDRAVLLACQDHLIFCKKLDTTDKILSKPVIELMYSPFLKILNVEPFA